MGRGQEAVSLVRTLACALGAVGWLLSGCSDSSGGEQPMAMAGQSQAGSGSPVAGGVQGGDGSGGAGTSGSSQGGGKAGASSGAAGSANGAGTGGCDSDCECGPEKPCPGSAECAAGACRDVPLKPHAACQYRFHADHDYYFCDVQVAQVHADAACSSVGMHLVHLESAGENGFIDQTLTHEACCPSSLAIGYKWAGLWIGAGDAELEGDWRWLGRPNAFWQGAAAGMPVGGAYTSWDAGQPNDGNLGPAENCARTRGSLWNDTPCELDPSAMFTGIGYICER